jgi:hypothetical protein
MDSMQMHGRTNSTERTLAAFLLIWMVMMTSTGICRSAWSAEHPRLIVRSDMYPKLRERAANEPWRKMKEIVKGSTALTYRGDGSYYEKLHSMSKLMRQAALAYILFPEKKREYALHIVDQMRYWESINEARLERPLGDWASMISGGDAFFHSVLALDIIHNELTEGERAEIEARLRIWYEFERDKGRGSWYLAKYGAMGLWALYSGDQSRFEEYAAAYDRRLRQHFTSDGVALVGGNYASARLAAGEFAKTYFMDVLTFVGWYDYYSDPLLGQFYEWFYGGMVTPTRHYPIFQDCRETEHSGTRGYPANYRAYRFSARAAASAAWFEPGSPDPGILSYVLIGEQLPEPLAPSSQLLSSGYAALWEEEPHERSMMGVLWAPDKGFSHDHFEINAIHLTGYGKTLVRNSGYEGWGRPVPGFSWPYVSGFDIRSEWDYAVSGNIVYLDRDEPHLSKTGGGLEEGILHPAVDYATGHSGEAVKGGIHLRSMLLVKDRSAGAVPYFVLFDEVVRSDLSDSPMRVALHPPAMDHEVVAEREMYRWSFGEDIYLTVFLATPADEGTRLKRGGLSQMDEAPMYLHAEYDFSRDRMQAATVLFPHVGEGNCPEVQRIAGENFTGAKIGHGEGLVDLVFEAADGGMEFEGVALDGRAGLLRMNGDEVDFYLVRRGRRLLGAGAIGFEADDEISVVIQEGGGRIASPGTDVTFFANGDELQVVLDGVPVDVVSREAGRVTIHVPVGSHSIEFGESVGRGNPE